MRKLINRIRAIPHLFAKLTILYCILFATGASVYSFLILGRTGYDATSLLSVVLAFFGGELLLLCLKTVLGERKPKDKGDKPGEE